MSKSERKRIISEDRKSIQALKSRGTANPLPFTADPDDHCETSPAAYKHIAPVLNLIAKALNKEPCDLQIYDPYYCAGGMVHHLNQLGFKNVYNKCEDFYASIAQEEVPAHDVVLTNPPYSGDHFDKLLKFLQSNNKPALLLLPEHFFAKLKSFDYSAKKFCFMTPPERYHYWTPDGMRPEHDEKDKDETNNDSKKRKKKQHKNLVLGSRNSPFASHWFICMEPLMSNASFVSMANENKGGGNGKSMSIQLVDGCCVYARQEDIVPTTFKGTTISMQQTSAEGEGDGNESHGKKKRKKRHKDKEKMEESSKNPFF